MKYFFILLMVITPTIGWGYGSPDYLPDTTHPRIFLTSAVISGLQAKVAASDPDWLALKARADVIVARTVAAYDRYPTPDGYIYYAYQGGPWLEAAQVLGLAYKATGQTNYRDKLLELGAAIAAAGNAPVIVDSGYPTRSVAAAAAFIYDWCYADLGATLKTNLITAINGWYSMLHNGTAGMYIPNDGNNNYLGGHILGMGLCGIATYGDNATAPAINALVKSWWEGPVETMFANEGKGGAILESYNYGPNHFFRLFQYALALKTASGKDIFSSYSSRLITNYFYSLKPNRWQSTDEGDMAGSFTGIMGSALPLLLSSVDTSTEGDKMAFFANNFATPYGGNQEAIALQTAGPVDKLLFKSSRTKTDYRTTEPTYYRSLGDNHLFVRSDWTDSAVWSSFVGSAAKLVDHQQRVAGHIAIQRGNDYLLVNAGQWKGASGISGAPETMTQTNNNQNTLITNGSAGVWGVNYAGGQGNWGRSDSVLKYESSAGVSYMKADLTSAYDLNTGTNLPGRDLTYWHRNYVYLGGGTFVLYDRVRMRTDSISKEFRFHLHNQSTNTNNAGLVKSVVGSSALYVKQVYPVTSVLTTSTSDNAAGNPVLKLTDSITSPDFNPLTILIADSNSSVTPTITGIDTTGMIGVETGGKVAMFSKDGTTKTSAFYSISLGTSYNHTLVDMSPGSYTVTKDGATLGTFTASSQGVLHFTSAGGGTFIITQTGVLPVCVASHLFSCTDSSSCASAEGNRCSGACQNSPCVFLPLIKSIKLN